MERKLSRPKRTMQRVLSGVADGAISFRELRQLLIKIGFSERIRGDHHIYVREDVEEILNLQPRGGAAKPYQVRQVRDVIIRHRLGDSV